MRIAFVTNTHDQISGAFLRGIDKSLFDKVEIDVFTLKMKHKDFSLIKKIKYFFKFIGLIRYLKYILGSRSDSNVECVAQELGLSLCFTDINDLEGYLKKKDYDVGLVLSLGHILYNRLLQLPKFGFFNFHPGSLVNNRGPSPLFWNLYYNEDYVTVNLHKMTDKIDRGEVIVEKRTKINHANEDELGIKAGKLAAEIFNESVLALPQIKGYSVEYGAYRKRPTVFRRHIFGLRKVIDKFR